MSRTQAECHDRPTAGRGHSLEENIQNGKIKHFLSLQPAKKDQDRTGDVQSDTDRESQDERASLCAFSGGPVGVQPEPTFQGFLPLIGGKPERERSNGVRDLGGAFGSE